MPRLHRTPIVTLGRSNPGAAANVGEGQKGPRVMKEGNVSNKTAPGDQRGARHGYTNTLENGRCAVLGTRGKGGGAPCGDTQEKTNGGAPR